MSLCLWENTQGLLCEGEVNDQHVRLEESNYNSVLTESEPANRTPSQVCVCVSSECGCFSHLASLLPQMYLLITSLNSFLHPIKLLLGVRYLPNEPSLTLLFQSAQLVLACRIVHAVLQCARTLSLFQQGVPNTFWCSQRRETPARNLSEGAQGQLRYRTCSPVSLLHAASVAAMGWSPVHHLTGLSSTMALWLLAVKKPRKDTHRHNVCIQEWERCYLETCASVD